MLCYPFLSPVRRLSCRRAVVAVVLACLALSSSGLRGAGWTLTGWNNLGMHCMDSDFSVFCILPPYNTVQAQLIDDNGNLVTNDVGLTVTYEAVADPDGSLNTTAIGKTNFWDYALPLFGVALPADTGLPVPGPASFHMPGVANTPQGMAFEPAASGFVAYGIPITPYDDAGLKNPYPLMRLTARQGGTVLASTDTVLPVSDEMDCRACHGSGSVPAAQPLAGWVNLADSDRDYRLNVLRLHDERQTGNPAYTTALTARGYHATGLYATVVTNGVPILCAACHASEALPGSGQPGIRPLTAAIHGRHATVTDPTNGLTLEAAANRSACYLCHPGSTTRCLRGAMGRAVAPDGTLQMQCQNCHGSMTAVGNSARTGWLDEPNCQNCHTGTALQNSGQIRYTSVFTGSGARRTAANPTFATNPNTPAAGLSLYRFSSGHGGLNCQACHGSTHAEFPAAHRNDNLRSIQHQGHAGPLIECASCHARVPSTTAGGPHGMHPVGQSWVKDHPDRAEDAGAAQCRACHGLDYRGTVLSRSQADRTLAAFGTQSFWRGYQIGCYACHDGPGDDDENTNRPPLAVAATANTTVNTPVAIALGASDRDGDPLTLRIVSQATHGNVGLAGTAATYYPERGFVGGDSFTFAASDGQADSNLATVTIAVNGGEVCTYIISPVTQPFTAFGGADHIQVMAGVDCGWLAVSNEPWITLTAGSSGTLAVAGYTFTVTQAGSELDVTGTWTSLLQKCRTAATTKCSLKGQFTVRNQSAVAVPRSVLALYLSDDGSLTGATLLKTLKVRKLNPGQNASVRVSLNLPPGVSASERYVVALVDAADDIPDANTANNIVPFGPLP